MAPRIEKLSPSLIRVIRDDGVYTGIDTGIRVNSPALRRLAGRQRDPGWIVRGDSVEQWDQVSLIDSDGNTYVYGPEVDGRFLAEALDDETVDRLALLRDVAHAYARLEERGVAPEPVNTRAIMVVEGGVFFLPANLMQAIREHQDEQEALRYSLRFAHPDKSPQANVCHFLAVAAYYVMTGEYPFDATRSEELNARVRAGQPVPPILRRPELRDDVSGAIVAALEGDKSALTPAEWSNLLGEWSQKGVEQNKSDEELAEIRARADKEIRRIERGFVRKERVRKNWRTGLIVAIIAVGVLWVPGTMLKSALMPPLTAGMDAPEVVTAFYTSMNSLNHELMSDATARGVAKDLIRQVTTLYVVERQRLGLGLEAQVAAADPSTSADLNVQGGLVDAQQWRDNGMPSLAQGASPYGVANLVLTELSSSDTDYRCRVTYEEWLPLYGTSDQPPPDPGYEGYLMTDELALRPFRNTWKIYEITQISQEPLDIESLRQGG